MVNLAEMTDDDLLDLMSRTQTEWSRRGSLQAVVDNTPGLREGYMTSLGREMGTEYVAPLGAHDAYPKDWEVSHEGLLYYSTRDGANGIPGDSVDWRRKGEREEILAWEQPRAGSEYAPGAIVSHVGRVWRNDHTGPNGWTPGVPHSQWTDLGPLEDYTPEG